PPAKNGWAIPPCGAANICAGLRRRGSASDETSDVRGDVNRVVVTGWGVLSSIGHTAEHHWASLARGVCGIAPAGTIPTDQLTQQVAAEVKSYEPLHFLTEREDPKLDRAAQCGVIAARET